MDMEAARLVLLLLLEGTTYDRIQGVDSVDLLRLVWGW